MTPKLKLDDCAETRLFRALTDKVKTDPTLRPVWKVFRDWSDSADDRTPISGPAQMPGIEFFPAAGPEELWSPGKTIAPMFVECRLWVAGLRVDNVANLWAAVVNALRPPDHAASLAFQRHLQQCGAETGQVLVSRPAFASLPDAANASYFTAVGQLKVMYYPQKQFS